MKTSADYAIPQKGRANFLWYTEESKICQKMIKLELLRGTLYSRTSRRVIRLITLLNKKTKVLSGEVGLKSLNVKSEMSLGMLASLKSRTAVDSKINFAT